MQFKGDEFVRNIEIEKEKAELKKQTEALDAEKRRSVIKPQQLYDDEPVIVDIKEDHFQELNDIRLDDDSNSATKKKYIMLSIALIVLFILTIVIIRLISSDKKENELFNDQKVENIKQDSILNAPNANEKYQDLIDKKAKQTIQNKLNLDTIVQEEIPLPKINKNTQTIQATKKVTTDVFGMEKKTVTKKVIKKVIPKKVSPKKTIPKKIIPIKRKTIKATTTTKVTGSYVQVGAFINEPSKVLLKQIQKSGYNYIIHKMTIKNTLYKKVLIGPYKNRDEVNKVINKIKKDLNKPGAYVLRLK